MGWFGVVSLHEWQPEGDRSVVEERVVLFEARDADEALAKAEVEAKAYQGGRVRWLGSLVSYECDGPIGDGSEVFSLLRRTARRPEEFDDVFFADTFSRDK